MRSRDIVSSCVDRRLYSKAKASVWNAAILHPPPPIMALFYIPARDLERLEHDGVQTFSSSFIDLIPAPPLNQLESLAPRTPPLAPGNVSVSLYRLTSHLNELCSATPNSQSFLPRNLAEFVTCYRAPFHASPELLDALNGKLRLEPDSQQRDQLCELTQRLINSYQEHGLELPSFELTNDPFLLKDVRNQLRGCIDHIEFDDLHSLGRESLSVTASDDSTSAQSGSLISSAFDITQAEDILLADLLLCGTASYHFQASNDTVHGIPFQLSVIFRQANLILHHLYAIGRVDTPVQYAFAHEDNYYVPDAKGFHVASPDESVVVIDYRIPSRWSNVQLDAIYDAVDPSRGSTIRAVVHANGRPTVVGPTRDSFVDEVLYHVSQS